MLEYDIADERESIEMRKRVAYVGEDKRLYDYMTVGRCCRVNTLLPMSGWPSSPRSMC